MIHLHVHSEYSLRDSTIRLEELVDEVKGLKMGAVALTDHGNMSGSFEFYALCKEKGIKPIIGIELYMVSDMRDKSSSKRFHLVLLAQNTTGYENLLEITSIAGSEGFYYVPRADFSVLKAHKQGVIALTGCISSVLYVMGNHPREINRIMRLLTRIYPRLFLEIMPHDGKEQHRHNIVVSNLSKDFGALLVATQDAHYLSNRAKEIHDHLMHIQGRDPYTVPLFLTKERQMRTMMERNHPYLGESEIATAIANTDLVSNIIGEYNIPLSEFDFPAYDKKPGGMLEELLNELPWK